MQLFLVVICVLCPSLAYAEPDPPPTLPTQLTSPAVCTSGEHSIMLPTGFWIVPFTTRANEDAHLTALQSDVIRLTAERNSYRSSAATSPWKWMAVSLAVGFAAGAVVGR